ncbi:hypothetical protein VF14_36715 [Nostoc linckia z18]|uniref:Uncharacterized protein n=2 Tax=Nostoc linckia TaxID=92942 RepID=A0A9Q5Z480_NOSLI|nr:hypothetical protein [Nostoc linckia]PHK25671.1 hypothetical protein VF12_36750 [Nostoc linckia z15]PHK36002.1 hypothetical protein VF13_37260 [Nostoc linckia z16]PHJ55753.1 hypothetical protein VF02_35510 [Nostoc linckia z1]PHJ57060.1 hypothetical protein VF05_36265 [Nostoc linckia z3]PHJ69417.1 hypothetical protein VF03_24070 [Nostoc linckia z2]
MIRAKFTCQQNILNHETQTAEVILCPVTTNPPSEENLAFWNATPAGEIKLQITNPQASAQFAVGTSYYVDFTPAN